MEYAIRLKGLTKSFQKEKVLKDINHDLKKGRFMGSWALTAQEKL